MPIYKDQTVRFNDVLSTLAEHYARRVSVTAPPAFDTACSAAHRRLLVRVVQSGTISPEDVELVAKQVGLRRKKQEKAIRDPQGFVYTTEHYFAARRIVAFLRDATAVKHPEGVCAAHLAHPEKFTSGNDSPDAGSDGEGDDGDAATDVQNGVELVSRALDAPRAGDEIRGPTPVGQKDTDAESKDADAELSTAIVARDNTFGTAI